MKTSMEAAAVHEVTNAQLAEVTRKAAQRIAEKGRCINNLWDASDDNWEEIVEARVCLHGALITEIRLLLGQHDIRAGRLSVEALHQRIKSVMVPLLPEIEEPVWRDSDFPGGDLNDHEDTTDEDVQKLLLQVADRLDVL